MTELRSMRRCLTVVLGKSLQQVSKNWPQGNLWRLLN